MDENHASAMPETRTANTRQLRAVIAKEFQVYLITLKEVYNICFFFHLHKGLWIKQAILYLFFYIIIFCKNY